MPKIWTVYIIVLACVSLSQACNLKEIRSKTKFGVEHRAESIDKSDLERYLVQEAIQFKWDNGVDTTVSYRRRDVRDSPSADYDNGYWFEIGVPIWKAPNKSKSADARIALLEERIAHLERSLERVTRTNAQHGTN